jgi:hypothetical protein
MPDPTQVPDLDPKLTEKSTLDPGKIVSDPPTLVNRSRGRFCTHWQYPTLYTYARFKALLRIRIRRILMFLGLLDPDPFVIKQK